MCNVTGSERLLTADRLRELTGFNLGLYDALRAETMESGETSKIGPDVKDDPFLRGLVARFSVHADADEGPLCGLIDHPDAEALLRDRVP